jgi:O-antigen/teichoic acid export membrane protein
MSIGEERPVEAVDAVVVPPDPAPLAKQTLAYGLTGLIVPIAGMITLPIFARVFTQDQYGTVEVATTTTTVALTLTDAGLTAAALRSFYDYGTGEETSRRAVLTTAFAATSMLALLVAAVMAVFRHHLSEWLFGGSTEATLVLILAASIVALNTSRYLGEVMRVRLMAFNYLAAALIASVVTTAVGVTGVLALDWGVNGVFFAGVFGSLLAAVYGVVVTRHAFIGRFSRRQLTRMLRFGLPLVPATLGSWALALVDRLILTHVGSLAQVGQYAIANRLASLINIGMTAFLFALTPFLLSTFAEDPEQEKAARGRTLTYLTFILSLCGLVLTLFAKEAIDVLAPKFHDAYKAVGPLAFGLLAYGLTSLLTTGLLIARTTVRGALLTLVAAGVNIGLNFALIPPWGIVGSAVATAVGYGLLAASFYVLSQHVYPTPYEPRKVLLTIVLAAALGVFGVVSYPSTALAIVVKLLAVGAFLVGMWVTRTMTGAELSQLWKFMSAMIPLRAGRARA